MKRLGTICFTCLSPLLPPKQNLSQDSEAGDDGKFLSNTVLCGLNMVGMGLPEVLLAYFSWAGTTTLPARGRAIKATLFSARHIQGGASILQVGPGRKETALATWWHWPGTCFQQNTVVGTVRKHWSLLLLGEAEGRGVRFLAAAVWTAASASLSWEVGQSGLA